MLETARTSPTKSVPALSTPVPGASVSWRASPWQSHRGRVFVCGFVIMVFSALVALGTSDWLWGAITAVALLLVTLEAFVPTLYVADDAGLRIHGPLRSRQVRWADIKRVAFEDDGALLSTHAGRRVTVQLDAPSRGPWLAEQAKAHAT